MLKFTGTYYEFGEYIGRQLIENNHDFAVDMNDNIMRRQLKVYQKYYPEMLEQAKGIAHVTRLPEKQVIYNEIATHLEARKRRLAAKKGCTIFAVRQGRQVFIGRNYDWMPRVRNAAGY